MLRYDVVVVGLLILSFAVELLFNPIYEQQIITDVGVLNNISSLEAVVSR